MPIDTIKQIYGHDTTIYRVRPNPDGAPGENQGVVLDWSDDNGATWDVVSGDLPGANGPGTRIVPTGSYVYAFIGGSTQEVRRAPLDNDESFELAPGWEGLDMSDNGLAGSAMFDGTNWIVITPQASVGV